MAGDAVKRIAAAEKAAEELIARAGAEAKRIVSDASRQGREALEQAIAGAHAEVEQMVAAAEESAARAAADILKSADDDCTKIRVLAEGRMDRAVSVIAERVVNG